MSAKKKTSKKGKGQKAKKQGTGATEGPVKSHGHIQFKEVDGKLFEFYLARTGLQVVKAPVVGNDPDNEDEQRTGDMILNGLNQVKDYIKDATGKTPTQLKMKDWTEANKKVRAGIIDATGVVPDSVGEPVEGEGKKGKGKSNDTAAPVGSRTKQGGATLFGFNITAVIRWLGYHGFDKPSCTAALTAQGVEVNPNTISTQLYHGRKQKQDKKYTGGGPIVDLSKEDAALLLEHKPDGKKVNKVSKKKAAKKSTKKKSSGKGKTSSAKSSKKSTKKKKAKANESAE